MIRILHSFLFLTLLLSVSAGSAQAGWRDWVPFVSDKENQKIDPVHPESLFDLAQEAQKKESYQTVPESEEDLFDKQINLSEPNWGGQGLDKQHVDHLTDEFVLDSREKREKLRLKRELEKFLKASHAKEENQELSEETQEEKNEIEAILKAKKNHDRAEILDSVRESEKRQKKYQRQWVDYQYKAKKREIQQEAAEKIRKAYDQTDERQTALIAETQQTVQNMYRTMGLNLVDDETFYYMKYLKEEGSKKSLKFLELETEKLKELYALDVQKKEDLDEWLEKRQQMIDEFQEDRLEVLENYGQKLNKLQNKLSAEKKSWEKQIQDVQAEAMEKHRKKAAEVAELSQENKFEMFNQIEKERQESLAKVREDRLKSLNQLEKSTKEKIDSLTASKDRKLQDLEVKVEKKLKKHNEKREKILERIEEERKNVFVKRREKAKRISKDRREAPQLGEFNPPLNIPRDRDLKPKTPDVVFQKANTKLSDAQWQKDVVISAAEREKQKSLQELELWRKREINDAVISEQKGFYDIPIAVDVREHLREIKEEQDLIQGK